MTFVQARQTLSAAAETVAAPRGPSDSRRSGHRDRMAGTPTRRQAMNLGCGHLHFPAARRRAPAAHRWVSAILAASRAPLSGHPRYPGIHRCHAGSKRSVGIPRRHPRRRSSARPSRCPAHHRSSACSPPRRRGAASRTQKARSPDFRGRLDRHRFRIGPSAGRGSAPSCGTLPAAPRGPGTGSLAPTGVVRATSGRATPA
jgi:hypothetical protein